MNLDKNIVARICRYVDEYIEPYNIALLPESEDTIFQLCLRFTISTPDILLATKSTNNILYPETGSQSVKTELAGIE
ncbi:hypothetical protein EGO51_10670 [Haloarcula hispanica]|uniref:Uncharacterized protein n=1 Tax=Haloarcula hispanica TaxID=51589 RepID=A0A5J5LL45_HALHI|nr:hypothetical protein [Haloarcula hispanica]KAA9410246.1 hypothetical protein EGO51_10670 [Haloarcula hispanica]